MRGHCSRCALQLIAAALLSHAAAAQEPDGFWAGVLDAPLPSTIHGGTVIHADRLPALLQTGGALIVDVSNAPRRPDTLAPGAPWIPVPHRAIPGALWLPGAGAAELTPQFDAFFRARLARATQGNPERAIVVYCHDRCWLSWNAAKRAILYGYRQVYWFPEGIEGWTAAGLPTDATPPETVSAGTSPPGLAVLDIELTGDLGGPELAAPHAARLEQESARLRQDIAATQLFRVLDTASAQPLIDRLKSQQLYLHDCNGCDLEVGRGLGADEVLVAWVNRVSGLILTLTYEIHDVATGQIAARKSFDFRGDNDAAWTHAIDYMVRDLKTEPGARSTP